MVFLEQEHITTAMNALIYNTEILFSGNSNWILHLYFFFQHLIERSWYAVTETCLAFTVFRDDFSPKFVALFTLLLFLKCFHWLAEDRIDYVSHMYFWKKKYLSYLRFQFFNETCIRIRINQSKHVPVLRIQLYSFASYCCHWPVYLYNFALLM